MSDGHFVELRFVKADPDDPAISSMLANHLAFARDVTPPGHVHALDKDGLRSSDVNLYAAVHDREVVAIGALRDLDDRHVEIKSMHTAEMWRGRGAGRFVLQQLIAVARRRGCERISLETGTMEAFEPARRLYASAGFRPCEPFGDYEAVPNSVCMSLWLEAGDGSSEPAGSP